jgi:class 3 adenylate cyclase
MRHMGGVAIVVFSDLVDSTALLASLGDDRMELVRRAHVGDVNAAVEGAGGRVVKTLGDGVMASFESALGALRAAAEIQVAVERLDAAHGGIGIAARVGVAAGEPIRDGEDLHGMSVVIASRLSSAAGTGEVLVQDLVQALVASRDGVALGEIRDFDLKGVPAPVRASRLLWRELVRADGGDGVASAGAGEADAPEPPDGESSTVVRLPPILAAYAEEPLIGRDREIAMLREQTAPRPGRRAVLISGEPGIGKTRHAAAAATAADAEGATVVLARCPPEAVVPFEPWVRAIGELALAGDEAWRATLARAAGPELSALVPELDRAGQLDQRASAGGMIAAEGARYRLLRGIGAALGCAARDSPLHVVLDDAQWCDPASAQALRHLLDSPPSTDLVLLVTAREGEMGRGHPVSRALSDLRRTGDLSELRLAGLDVTGMAALVGARVGRAITPALAARLLDRTSGNPFFAGELVRDLDGRGGLRDGDALDAVPVPEAVTGLVEERLAQLEPTTERLLTAVAAIGPSAPVSLAARAAGLDREEAERAARDALAERLVEDVATAEPTIAFTHALVREALLAETGAATRARLHLAIARALEEGGAAEPAELARHYGLAVDLAGAEPAIAAHRAAAVAAADGHDHEGAAAHLRQVISLLPDADPTARAPTLLELGEQELLSADLVRARRSFREAIEAARRTGDAGTLARAALGFAGGDIGFGYEFGTDDPASVKQLREGLEALGDEEPRLSLQMIHRLVYLLVITDEGEETAGLARRAEELGQRLGDPEAQVLARFTRLVATGARGPDPLRVLDSFEGFIEMLDQARECDREELLFRVVGASAVAHYVRGRIAECERAIEWAREIAERLGSPRFTWEIDLMEGLRCLDRGDRAGGEALVRRAGSVVRRLRPDLHIGVEVLGLLVAEWIHDGEAATSRTVYEARERVMPMGMMAAFAAFATAFEGDLEAGRRRLRAMRTGDLEPLRRPDLMVPMVLWALAYTATLVGDREAGAWLRPMFEPLRSRIIAAVPAVGLGQPAEWHIGRLELLAGQPEAAELELRTAIARADACEIVWVSSVTRIDLARALHRQGDALGAAASLAEGESIARRYDVGWAVRNAAEARAEIEGVEPAAKALATERSRPIRALASRGGRRALAARVSRLDDVELERSFAEPRRQRALLKLQARSFQPAQANGFSGVIAYELEPYAIDPPPDAPWRWAIEVDSSSGRALLLEQAPLDATVTIHIGLADWVRVVAGIEDALAVMVAGRCSVEGDVIVALRLEAMFGGQ